MGFNLTTICPLALIASFGNENKAHSEVILEIEPEPPGTPCGQL